MSADYAVRRVYICRRFRSHKTILSPESGQYALEINCPKCANGTTADYRGREPKQNNGFKKGGEH